MSRSSKSSLPCQITVALESLYELCDCEQPASFLFINISASHSLLPLGIPPRAELLSPPTPSAMTHFRSFHTSAPEWSHWRQLAWEPGSEVLGRRSSTFHTDCEKWWIREAEHHRSHPVPSRMTYCDVELQRRKRIGGRNETQAGIVVIDVIPSKLKTLCLGSSFFLTNARDRQAVCWDK